MNYLVKSARAVTRILSTVIGDGVTSPTDRALKQNPYLGTYR
ncbi:MAG TPA: hypothetical protein VMW13_10400 [Dehalococcoidales bacterium]|nr:hypothetical protein [Dehalococcoidales bacterium]